MIQNILPPVVDISTKVLIVGSMPGVQSLQKQQYYGHPRNHFWPIIHLLTNEEIPQQYEQRLQLLKKYQIGLWDTIKSCEREGSLDSAIKHEIPNDFRALFARYPQIQIVAFNGTKSFAVFKKHIGLSVLEGRQYIQLPSSSPVPGKYNKNLQQKVAIWRQILHEVKK